MQADTGMVLALLMRIRSAHADAKTQMQVDA